jgi:hypothetical protein
VALAGRSRRRPSWWRLARTRATFEFAAVISAIRHRPGRLAARAVKRFPVALTFDRDWRRWSPHRRQSSGPAPAEVAAVVTPSIGEPAIRLPSGHPGARCPIRVRKPVFCRAHAIRLDHADGRRPDGFPWCADDRVVESANAA